MLNLFMAENVDCWSQTGNSSEVPLTVFDSGGWPVVVRFDVTVRFVVK
jgi:hypothetical protein